MFQTLATEPVDSGEFEGLEIDICSKIRQLGVDIVPRLLPKHVGPLSIMVKWIWSSQPHHHRRTQSYSTISQLLTTQMPLASWSIRIVE